MIIGAITFILGIGLFIITIVWIILDIKYKDRKERELINQITLGIAGDYESAKLNDKSTKLINDKYEHKIYKKTSSINKNI